MFPQYHCSLWSTVFLEPGDLSGSTFRCFDVSLDTKSRSGRIFDAAATNMRESGRIAAPAKITSVIAKVFPCDAAADMERLAQAYAEDDPETVFRIEETGVLLLDFTQTSLDIGPLWVRNFTVHADIPQYASFAVLLRFGASPLHIQRSYAVRIFLSGMYEKSNY